MKKSLLLFLLVLLTSSFAFSQLSGTKTIPGDYATVEAAITDLNNSGVGAGGVTFNVAAGHTETFSSVTAGRITATGTSANPIIFQKNGAGANPVITGFATGPTNYDYVICLLGADYITFDGIDLTAQSGTIEWGYALLKASATDGVQHTTIKNCKITLTNTNIRTYAIYSDNINIFSPPGDWVVTDFSGTNSYNKFYSNTFANCYNCLRLRGYSHAPSYNFNDWYNEVGKDGANTFTNFGGGSTVASGMYCAYQNFIIIANNNWTGTIANTTAAAYGLYFEFGNNANADIYNNTISVEFLGTTGSFTGMWSAAGVNGTSNTTNIYNNSVTNCTMPNATSGGFTGLRAMGGSKSNFYNNSVTNNTYGSPSVTATGMILGIYYQANSAGASSSQTLNFYGNTVANNTRIQSVSGNGTGVGIQFIGDVGTLYAHNNTVDSVNCGGSKGTMWGVYCTYNGVKNFYNNTITNILNTKGTTYGFQNLANAGELNFFNNKIQNITGLVEGSKIYGITQESAAVANIYNNFISELKTTNASAAISIAGMHLKKGTIGAYNNTIYLNASSTAPTFGTAGIYAEVAPVVDLRNNIVVNASTPGGPDAYTVALRYAGPITFINYAQTSNNNNFYAGTPGTNNLIYYDGVTPIQTIAAFQTFVFPREGSSVTENPPFVNVAVSPYDLHPQDNVATQCENSGSVVATPVNIIADYDNNARYPNPGYPFNPLYPPNAPDIGADEFGGIPLDKTPPSIVYTPLMFTSSLEPRTLTATITDLGGVPTSGDGLPCLYWRINRGTWNTAVGNYVSGSAYTFNFGSGVVLNDTVSYYVVAQDLALTPNIGSYPSAGAAGFTANPPACSTPPTTPYSYQIIGTICGIKTVGIGGDYENLTAAAAAINQSEITCPVTLLLALTYTSTGETWPIVIDPNPGSSVINTLTIKPNTGVTDSISGDYANGALIKIFNSNTIIDGSNTVGGTSRDLIIQNKSVTSPSVVLIGSSGNVPITNVSLKNTIYINGANTSSCIVVSDGATFGDPGYFNNITIQNNNIPRASYAVYCNATIATGNGSGLLITGNDIITSGVNSISLCGIFVKGVYGATVSNNNIGNFANTVQVTLTGISIATGTKNATISGNNIYNFSSTGQGPRGITISSGVVNANLMVSGNTITGLSTAGISNSVGIYYVGATSGITIKNNKISNITNSNPDGYASAFGIWLASSAPVSADASILNNAIWGVAGYGYPYASGYYYNGNGIVVQTGFGYNIYNNTVYMNTEQTLHTGSPAAIYIASTVTQPGAIDLRNNIFSSSQNIGTNRYAIFCQSTNLVFSNIDYNDYYTTGPNLGYVGANRATLADIQDGFGGNLNSLDLNPAFVGSDLSPTNVALMKKGVYLSAVQTDINGAIRTSPPDIGAYEFGVLTTTTAATGITSDRATLNGSVLSNVVAVTTFFDYGTTTAYGQTVAATPGTLSPGTAAQSISAVIHGLAPLTTYHFRARVVTPGGAEVVGQDSAFTTSLPLPENTSVQNVTIVNGQDTCFNATNTITVAGGGTTFTVQNGGSATMIAGQKIRYLPGTVVEAGGYMLGYISADNQYCGALPTAPVVAGTVTNPDPLVSARQSFRVYPNPTEGSFTIERTGTANPAEASLEIYGIHGNRVLTTRLPVSVKQVISLEGQPKGLYFIRVVSDGTLETVKLVKQ